MSTNIERNLGGILVVERKNNCQVCKELERLGFFQDLDNMAGQPGWPDDVVTVDIENFNPSEVPKIFIIDQFYPNFKYMSNDVLQAAQSSGDNWKSVADDICYFNRVFDETGTLVPFEKYSGFFSLELIQKFCLDSDKELNLEIYNTNVNDDASAKLNMKYKRR
jgi:hypothetical protein